MFHCPAGSAAEAFALRHDIPYDDQTEYRFETVQQATPAGMLTVRLYAAHAMIERYEGQDEELILPASVQGKPVLVIGNGESPIAINGTDWDTLEQRQDAPNLKKIVIPEGVESISAKAIGTLSWVGQTEIVLPSTLKRIGESGLDLNTTVSLPAGIERLDRNFTSGKLADGFTVTPSLKVLSPEAFAACRGLTAFAQEGENGLFSVRDGVLYSADGSTLLAYPKDSGAAEVSVPEGVVTVGSHAFGGCTGLAAVTLPASLAAAEDYAFSNCDKLASVTFSDASGPVTLGKYVFAYCDALTAVHFGTTETIGANAFRGCGLLAAADLPEGLLTIGAYAFYDTAVRNVKLPDSLRVIGDGAFGGSEARPMTDEAELIIGPHVTQIGDSAFESLEVTRFRVVQENETYAAAEGLLTDKSGTRLICVPSAKAGELTVPEGTLHIED
ncbi:MAG: leucine-rich repeat protein, partial [Thermoguttaceae bacterium]|nr:leucine-rich repeat protein [Thermoguttaceae bacterium]